MYTNHYKCLRAPRRERTTGSGVRRTRPTRVFPAISLQPSASLGLGAARCRTMVELGISPPFASSTLIAGGSAGGSALQPTVAASPAAVVALANTKKKRKRSSKPKARRATAYCVTASDCPCRLTVTASLECHVPSAGLLLTEVTHRVIFTVKIPRFSLHSHELGTGGERASAQLIPWQAGALFASQVKRFRRYLP
jgi:hypothetical protein